MSDIKGVADEVGLYLVVGGLILNLEVSRGVLKCQVFAALLDGGGTLGKDKRAGRLKAQGAELADGLLIGSVEEPLLKCRVLMQGCDLGGREV